MSESATAALRRMLDERGVEWMPSVFDPQHETFYSVENGVGFIVTEFPEIGRMSLACDMRITPAQAIAATLGDADATTTRQGVAGTCHEVADKLREKVQRQADELTAVRRALEQRNSELRPWKAQAERFVAENAKLRELCADMGMCLTWQSEPHGYMMDGCDHCRFRGKTNGMCGLGKFKGRMRELGVEVSE